MDIELGIQNVARTVTFSTEQSADEVNAAIADAVENGKTINLTDDKGRRIVVPAGSLGYAIIGSETFSPGFSILGDQLVSGFISQLRVDDCVLVFYFRLRRFFAQADASIDDFLNCFVAGEVLPQRVRLAFTMPIGSASHQQVVPARNGEQTFTLF